MEKDELENRFSYHPPKVGQNDVYESIRERAKGFAAYIDEMCPESREKALAFTALEEAVMWANASIARRT